MNKQNDDLQQLYGAGWCFPLTFSVPQNGESALAISAGKNNVAQSLSLLFRTLPGERIMLPDYGCDLHSVMFAGLSQSTLASLQSEITECVARYEPRAEAVVVTVREDTTQTTRGVLRVDVSYRLAGQQHQIKGTLDVHDGGAAGGGAWAI